MPWGTVAIAGLSRAAELQKKTAIVVTTIFEPAFLAGYVENIRRHGREDDVELIVVVDRKTPASVHEACASYRRRGRSVLCPTLAEQDAFLVRFPSMLGRIPYDSDNRRNIGFLMALDRGAEVLVSIDDDNYCLADADFVGEHSIVGEICTAPEVVTSDGWFNIASMLAGGYAGEIFPRGFPYAARHRAREVSIGGPVSRPVAINAGLWLSDPDVDAVTRLALAPRVSSADARSVLLGPRVWSPVNTQNTAVAREAVAAYYYVRMGHSLGGMTIDRYGDILSGYFVQKCAKALGHGIRVGSPVADHRRTPHNLFRDLYHELAGMVIVEELLPWLADVGIEGDNYAEAYLSLADRLEAQSARFSGFVWDQGAREFLASTADHMRAWVDAVRSIG
jgi:hypothetical protein